MTADQPSTFRATDTAGAPVHGAIADGANDTEAFQFLAQKAALKLELRGMRHSSGRLVYAHVKRLYGLSGSRPAVLASMEWLAKLVINRMVTVAAIRAGQVRQCPECAAAIGAAHREDCPAA